MDENRMSPGYVYFRSQNCTTKHKITENTVRDKNSTMNTSLRT